MLFLSLWLVFLINLFIILNGLGIALGVQCVWVIIHCIYVSIHKDCEADLISEKISFQKKKFFNFFSMFMDMMIFLFKI